MSIFANPKKVIGCQYCSYGKNWPTFREAIMDCNNCNYCGLNMPVSLETRNDHLVDLEERVTQLEKLLAEM